MAEGIEKSELAAAMTAFGHIPSALISLRSSFRSENMWGGH